MGLTLSREGTSSRFSEASLRRNTSLLSEAENFQQKPSSHLQEMKLKQRSEKNLKNYKWTHLQTLAWQHILVILSTQEVKGRSKIQGQTQLFNEFKAILGYRERKEERKREEGGEEGQGRERKGQRRKRRCGGRGGEGAREGEGTERIATKESKKGWEKSLANVTELEAMNEPTIRQHWGKPHPIVHHQKTA